MIHLTFLTTAYPSNNEGIFLRGGGQLGYTLQSTIADDIMMMMMMMMMMTDRVVTA